MWSTVAPLLALTLVPAWHGRPAAQLLRVSMLTYGVYTYAYYVFGAELNAALLAHIATFTTTLYALVLSLAALDVDRLAGAFRPRTPVRTVALIIGLLAVLLAAIQVSGVAGFALTATVPQEPSQLVVPLEFTRLGAVLDVPARPRLPGRCRLVVAATCLGLPAGERRPWWPARCTNSATSRP